MEEFDFDPEKLRLPEELAAQLTTARVKPGGRGMPPELEAKLAAHKVKGGRANRSKDDLFVQIPIKAIAAFGEALSEKQWIVALYVYHQIFAHRLFSDKPDTVKIANQTLATWGVSPKAKNRALRAFEKAGLITVQWRGRKSPIVTLRADLLRPTEAASSGR
jgi:hypothetical protein